MTRKRLKRLIMSLGVQRNDAEDMLHECRIFGKTHAEYWAKNWKLIQIRALWLLETGEQVGLPASPRFEDGQGGITGSVDFSRLANALNCAAEAFIAGITPHAISAAEALRRFTNAVRMDDEKHIYQGYHVITDKDFEKN